ncbi:MAG TPA: histidine kinase [Pyrinomonadaceae bacterium]|nr:histidine kinase [Pyrinomonadaceae bacterium]
MTEESRLNRRWVKWLIIFSIWTLCGFFLTSQVAFQNLLSKNPISFWRILSWQLFSGYVWFLLTPLILWLGRRFPFEKGGWKVSLPAHLIISFVIALAQQAVDAYVLPKLGYLRSYQLDSFWETYKIFLLVNLHFGVAIYWAVLSIYQAVRYYRKYRERELATSKLEARLAQSRLQVLKMQLHPHFLFNTLNAISELIYKDRESAERMIGDLSDLLRLSFENLEVQEISLKQELEFLRKYLEIEQMRFHDRLIVEMEISPDTLDASVPNMILQPLVENAIKHGIAPRSTGGKIEIGAHRSNGSLELSVSDNGIGVPFNDLENLSEGVGISNTRRRLRHLYGEKHTFNLANAEKSGLRVNLTIPFKELES